MNPSSKNPSSKNPPAPNSIIHLGYQDIKITSKDFGEAQGFYSSDRHEISINSALYGIEVFNTLIHEILHACVYVYGLKEEFKDEDHEEKVVNALGNALTEVLTRNPELVSWISKNAKPV